MTPEAGKPTEGPAVQPSSGRTRTMRPHLIYGSVIAVLLVVIAGMYLTQQPWFTGRDNARTITIDGQATVKAEPDEYQFSPSYSVKNPDQTAALAELSAKSDEVVKKVKELGVPDKDIKTTASGYDFPIYYKQDPEERTQYMLSLTIIVRDKELAQKVQDYLITTNPVGALTPYVTFSEAKRKELEDTARTDAIKDAKQKADKMAKELGFSLKGVKAVNTGQSAIPIYGMAESVPGVTSSDSAARLSVQPGENDYTYSFSVEYYIR